MARKIAMAGLAPDRLGEPSIPKIIELTPNPSQPDEIEVKILTSMEGQVRMTVDPDADIQWITPKPPGLLRFKRGDVPRQFKLKVTPAEPKSRMPVKVRLDFVNSEGETTWIVTEEIIVGPGRSPVRADIPISKHLSGVDVTGHGIDAYVPPNAPTPRVKGGRP